MHPEDLEDETVKGLAKYMETRPKDWESARKSSGLRLSWSDVVHCIEVKTSTRTTLTTPPPRFSEPYPMSTTALSGAC